MRPVAPRRSPTAVAVRALLAALVVLGVNLPAAGADAPAGSVALFQFADDRLGEASGIARGIASPNVFYVQNDSGDEARFFAVDATTGRTLAVYQVPGATNVDWEDLAVAPDARGVASIWLADTGDNDAVRTEVRIYRVDEPTVPARGGGAQLSTAPPDVWRLNYPGGPRDAEALAVAPGGAMYLFDKTVLGPTDAYAVPLAASPDRVQAVTPIGTFRTRTTGTGGGPSPVGQRTVTGGSLSRSGDLLALRTYTDAYLWRVGRGGVAAAIGQDPVVVALPEQPQGEGVTIDGARLVVDSELVSATVWSVPLPDLPPVAVAPTSAAPTAPATTSAGTTAPSTPARATQASSTALTATVAIGIAVLAVVAAAGLYAVRRRSR